MSARTEREAVHYVICQLQTAGWTIKEIDDGGNCDEDRIKPADLNEAMETIFSVEDSFMFVTKNGVTHFVRFVLGNSPAEVVCDHSDPVGDPNSFRAVMDAITEHLDS